MTNDMIEKNDEDEESFWQKLEIISASYLWKRKNIKTLNENENKKMKDVENEIMKKNDFYDNDKDQIRRFKWILRLNKEN